MSASRGRRERRSSQDLCRPRWLLSPPGWRDAVGRGAVGRAVPEHPASGAARRGGAKGPFLSQDLEKESDTPLQQVSIEEILEEQRVEQQARQESEKLKVQALKERGLCVPRADTLDEY